MLVRGSRPVRSPAAQVFRESWGRGLLGGAGVLVLLAALQLGILAKLPYTTSLIFPAEADEVAARPTPDFRIGPIDWPVSAFATAPSLQPFRDEFRRHCAGKRGLAAALCVTNSMVAQFPFGEPEMDLFNPSFDPVRDLERHRHGQPGHCVTRSGMLSAELLSVGIPARVLQLLPARAAGHNIVEVWDDDMGWVLIDPSFGGLLGRNHRPVSAFAALAHPSELELLGGARAADGPGAQFYTYASLAQGDMLYPSPWLYLRTGPRETPWPFRGTFARIGVGQLTVGRAQGLLRSGILGCILAAAFCLLRAGLLWLRGRRIPVSRPPAYSQSTWLTTRSTLEPLAAGSPAAGVCSSTTPSERSSSDL